MKAVKKCNSKLAKKMIIFSFYLINCIFSNLEFVQIAVKRREAKSRGEKERYKHLNAEFQRIARRDKKPSSAINAKKQRKTTEWERLGISSRKSEIPKEHFMQR